jgi:chromosome partitioning protein
MLPKARIKTAAPSPPRSETYTPEQLARQCGVSARTVRYWEDTGKLPPAKRTPSRRRFYTDDDVALVRTLLSVPASVGHPSRRARVLSIINQKGGVGKTTTAVNLGAALAETGARVLLVDLDPQANCTLSVGVNWQKLPEGRNLSTLLEQDPLRDGIGSITLEDIVVPVEAVPNLFLAPGHLDTANTEQWLNQALAKEHRPGPSRR